MYRGSTTAICILLAMVVLLSATPVVAQDAEAEAVRAPIAIDLASLQARHRNSTTSATTAPRAVGRTPVDPLYPTLIGAGGALLGTGLLIAALSVRDLNDLRAQAEAGAIPCPCPAGEPTEEQLPYQQVWDNAQAGIGVGIGIAALGGIAMAVTIPVAIHQSRVRQVSLMAMLDHSSGPSGRPGGFQLTVVVR